LTIKFTVDSEWKSANNLWYARQYSVGELAADEHLRADSRVTNFA
jgi:hypothetical protein